MIELKLWFLTGINGVVLPLLIFFVSRWVKEQDKIASKQDQLMSLINTTNMALSDIKLNIAESKAWACEKFVTQQEFNRKATELHDSIMDFHTRMDTLNGIKNGIKN
jgi:hypothetical protein